MGIVLLWEFAWLISNKSLPAVIKFTWKSSFNKFSLKGDPNAEYATLFRAESGEMINLSFWLISSVRGFTIRSLTSLHFCKALFVFNLVALVAAFIIDSITSAEPKSKDEIFPSGERIKAKYFSLGFKFLKGSFFALSYFWYSINTESFGITLAISSAS